MFTKIIENIKNFLWEVKAETKKTSFPTKDETMGTTTVVIVIVLITTVYLWVLDVSLSKIIAKILP